MLNRHIKNDILSHLNNRKLFQIKYLSNNQEIDDFYEYYGGKMRFMKKYFQSTSDINLENFLDIKFPVIISVQPESYMIGFGPRILFQLKNLEEILLLKNGILKDSAYRTFYSYLEIMDPVAGCDQNIIPNFITNFKKENNIKKNLEMIRNDLKLSTYENMRFAFDYVIEY